MIDLKEDLIVCDDDLINRNRLKALLCDLCPENKRDINILLSIYDSGIPVEIYERKDISCNEYIIYMHRLIDENALIKDDAKDGLDVWMNALLGSERTVEIQREYDEILHESKKNIPSDFYGVFDSNYYCASIKKPTANSATFVFKKCCGGYLIEKFLGKDSIVVVPNEHKGYPVIKIGEGAFYDNKDLEIVFLNASVIEIHNSSFRNCSNLKAVYGGENLIYIGPHAFRGCRELLHFEVSNKLKYLGICTFRESGIENIKFPSSINYVPSGLCMDCYKLDTTIFHDDIFGIGKKSFEGTGMSEINNSVNLIFIDEEEARRLGIKCERHNVTCEEEMKKEIGLCVNYSPCKGTRDAQIRIVDTLEKTEDIIVINNIDTMGERHKSVLVYKDEIDNDSRRKMISMLLRPTNNSVFESNIHTEDGYRYSDSRMIIMPLTWWGMTSSISAVENTIIKSYKLDYEFDEIEEDDGGVSSLEDYEIVVDDDDNYNFNNEHESGNIINDEEVLTIGGTWKVDGQWRFTIDSVNTTLERSEYTDKNPEQVVIITYSYENLGYKGEFMPELFFGIDLDGQFAIAVDEAGEVAYDYPGHVSKKPQAVPIGARCTGAQSCIGLVNKSDSITLNIKEYDGNGVLQTIKYVLDVD